MLEPFEIEAPDSDEFPKSDNGENFIFYAALLPFRAMAAPFRIIIGMVSARRIDQDAAGRGIYTGEESPEEIEEIVNEYGRIFRARGRR